MLIERDPVDDGGSPWTSFTVLIRESDGLTFTESASCDGSDPTILANAACSFDVSVVRAVPYSLEWGSSVFAKRSSATRAQLLAGRAELACRPCTGKLVAHAALLRDSGFRYLSHAAASDVLLTLKMTQGGMQESHFVAPTWPMPPYWAKTWWAAERTLSDQSFFCPARRLSTGARASLDPGTSCAHAHLRSPRGP